MDGQFLALDYMVQQPLGALQYQYPRRRQLDRLAIVQWRSRMLPGLTRSARLVPRAKFVWVAGE